MRRLALGRSAKKFYLAAVRETVRFGRDARGIAAVEFGFIAPIMALMLVGAVEVTRAVATDKRFSVVTSMIADLVAREEKLTADDVKAIYDIAGSAMRPYDSAPLKVSIIPVASSPSSATNLKVYPAVTNRPSLNGAPQPAKCQAYTLSTGLMQANESVIVVESSYAFKPLFLGYVMGSMDWKDRAIAKPRKAACVDFDANGKPCGSCFS